MFHPLITPLTTYMYTADSQDSGTVSARDFEERLPPGGFSLRHGFPEWFGRARRRPSGACGQAGGEQARSPAPSSDCSPKTGGAGRPGYQRTDRPSVSMYRILGYIRSVFDDERVLDSVPLEAAGNPGAWHAWRTHQRRQGKLRGEPAPAQEPEAPAGSHQGAWPQSPAAHAGAAARQPGEWNWDGVWEDRVKKGIATSLSEPVLYGGSAAPDELVGDGAPADWAKPADASFAQIRFLAMEESDVNSVKENLRSTLGTVG